MGQVPASRARFYCANTPSTAVHRLTQTAMLPHFLSILILAPLAGAIGSSCGGERSHGAFTEEEPPVTTLTVPLEPVPLVAHDQWTIMGAEDDPLANHRPEVVFCRPDGIILHATGTLDIYLGECNYYAASQPSLAAIEVGDRIEIPFFHGDLCSERQ